MKVERSINISLEEFDGGCLSLKLLQFHSTFPKFTFKQPLLNTTVVSTISRSIFPMPGITILDSEAMLILASDTTPNAGTLILFVVSERKLSRQISVFIPLATRPMLFDPLIARKDQQTIPIEPLIPYLGGFTVRLISVRLSTDASRSSLDTTTMHFAVSSKGRFKKSVNSAATKSSFFDFVVSSKFEASKYTASRSADKPPFS